MGEQEKDMAGGCCLSSTDKLVLGDVEHLAWVAQLVPWLGG